MKIEQLYTGCLAEAAYYIESNGEVAIIDPLRETKPYIEKAKSDNARIKYVLETHFHADFVSGHIDLAKETGAEIVFGPTAKPNYDAHIATDGEILPLGKLKIKVLHTPGHTMESTCYLLLDENDKEVAVFTGDTLFIGDVGRPDLAVKSDLSEEDLAGFLFDSLREKIMTLPEDIVVYPGHGAGSACGKNLSKETFATLKNQLEHNYALRKDMTKAQFVEAVTEGLTAPPQYFPKNAVMNRMGYANINEVMKSSEKAFSADEFIAAQHEHEALVLDTRNQNDFRNGFIPGSIFIGLDGQFAPWVGALITDINQPILLVTEKGREEEAVLRLARVGYDNTIGFLAGGFETWVKAGKEVDKIDYVSAQDFSQLLDSGKTINVLDVRRDGEFKAEHVVGAQNVSLDYINSNMDKVNKDATYYVHCAGGYRSVIFESILKARGFHNLIDISGGMTEIRNTNAHLTEYVCPSTLS